jgi:putative flippase GtrA
VTSTQQAPALLRALWHRFGHLVREMGKFGTVGAITYVVDTLIFNLCLSPFGSFWAKAASTTVAATLAFIGNRFWTWRDRERSGLHREYLLYFTFNVIGLAIALACLWLSHDLLGQFWPEIFRTRLADNVSAQLVGTALGTLFRFWAYRRYVFTQVSSDLPGTDGRS